MNNYLGHRYRRTVKRQSGLFEETQTKRGYKKAIMYTQRALFNSKLMINKMHLMSFLPLPLLVNTSLGTKATTFYFIRCVSLWAIQTFL